MTSLIAKEKVNYHIKNALKLAGLPADESSINIIMRSLRRLSDGIKWHDGDYEEALERYDDIYQLDIIDVIMTPLILQMATSQRKSRMSNKERLQSKDKVRRAIQHTLQTTPLLLNAEDLRSIEDQIIHLFETVVRAPRTEKIEVYMRGEERVLSIFTPPSKSMSASSSNRR